VLTEQGFYEVRRAGPEGETAPAAVLAANLDLTEADLTPIDPKELAAAVLGTDAGTEPQGRGAPASRTPEQREHEQAIWWWLLAGALFLLAAETVVSNRMSRARR
jgi:hypothetical protein